MQKDANIHLLLVVRALPPLPYFMHQSQPQKIFQSLDGVIVALVESVIGVP